MPRVLLTWLAPLNRTSPTSPHLARPELIIEQGLTLHAPRSPDLAGTTEQNLTHLTSPCAPRAHH